MKAVYLFTFFILSSCICYGQGAQTYFDASANHYVNGRTPQAKQMVSEGLQKYPNDAKLKALAEKMKEEKQKEDQQKQEQKNKEQQKEQQQKRTTRKRTAAKGATGKRTERKRTAAERPAEQRGERKEGRAATAGKTRSKRKTRKRNKNENTPQLSEKLQQMKISEEKAKMILEAMKNQEIQYLQQNKRKATKPKDKTKPDW